MLHNLHTVSRHALRPSAERSVKSFDHSCVRSADLLFMIVQNLRARLGASVLALIAGSTYQTSAVLETEMKLSLVVTCICDFIGSSTFVKLCVEGMKGPCASWSG